MGAAPPPTHGLRWQAAVPAAAEGSLRPPKKSAVTAFISQRRHNYSLSKKHIEA